MGGNSHREAKVSIASRTRHWQINHTAAAVAVIESNCSPFTWPINKRARVRQNERRDSAEGGEGGIVFPKLKCLLVSASVVACSGGDSDRFPAGGTGHTRPHSVFQFTPKRKRAYACERGRHH